MDRTPQDPSPQDPGPQDPGLKDPGPAAPPRRAPGPRAGSARWLVLLAAALAAGAALLAISGVLGPGPAEEAAPEPDAAGEVSEAAPGRGGGARPSTAPAEDPGAGGEPAAGPDERAFDLNDLAIAALGEGRLDDAVELLEEAAAARPDVAAFGANLGEAYLRRARAGERGADAALEDYERALERIDDPERRGKVEALRDRVRRDRDEERDFVVEPTLHFTFKFDGGRAELAGGIERLKVLLEDTYQEFGERFRRRPVEAGEGRIEVILYDAEGFDAVTGLGDWAGGVFDGRVRVPVEDLRTEARLARVTGVLRHETAHAFSHSIGGATVPSWLNEGVAQWLEDPDRRATDVRIARSRLAAGGLFPLERLRGNLVGWEDRAQVARAYDQALAFVDHLVERYGEDLVFAMVGACRDGGVEGAAAHFRERTLVDLDQVLGDLADDLQR